jgi:hypothetical protein
MGDILAAFMRVNDATDEDLFGIREGGLRVCAGRGT